MVTLDVSSTINTLKVGAVTGSSTLVGDSTPQNLTVAGALTVGLNGNVCACASGGFGTITAGSLINRGSIVFETSGDLQISGNANNSGFLQTGFETGGHVVNIGGKLTNSGQFLLDGHGDAATLGSLVNSGTVDVSSASTLTVNGRVNNTGTITTGGFSPGGNTIVITGKLTNSGSLVLNGPGDTATIGSGGMGTALSNNSGGFIDIEGGSTLTINGDVTNSSGGGGQHGIFTGFNGSAGNTLTVTGNLSNAGKFELEGQGDTATVGSLTNNLSGVILVIGAPEGGASLNVKGDATNSGSITIGITGIQDALNIGGNFTNNGNVFTSELGSFDNTITVKGTLNNTMTGEFSLNGPGDLATIGGNLNNSGSVDVEHGSILQVDGNASNAGTLATNVHGLGASNTINITGRLTNQVGGQFILNGSLDFGDKATIGGNLNNSGLVDVDGMSNADY